MKFDLRIGLVGVLIIVFLSSACIGGAETAQKGVTEEQGGTAAKIIDLLQRKGIITVSEAEELKKELITEKQKEKAGFKVPQIGSDKMKIGGMIKFRNSHYRGHKEDRSTTSSGKKDYDTFKVPDDSLDIEGEITDDWNYGISLTMNEQDNGSNLRDIWMQWTGLPYAAITAGQFNVPFREGVDTIEEVEVVDSITPERDIGVAISGDILDEKITYALGVFNGNGINTSDDNDQKDIIGRVVVSPFKGSNGVLEGLSMGVSVQGGRQPNETSEGITYGGDRTRIGGLLKYEGNIANRGFKLQGEYIQQKRDRDDQKADISSNGWYAQATYELSPKWWSVYQYGVYNPNGKSSNDIRRTSTVGIKYTFNEYTSIQMDYRTLEYPNSKNGQELLTELTLEF
ncbi:OprO/OprP family phosphate-selective porin [bacterium]|nr:OprO/OprP family phosphate-selective porin [bacterium]